jgi:hypothetical protein
MMGVTLFGLFLTPVFYAVVRRFSGRGVATPESVPAHGSPDGAHTEPTERAGSPGRGAAGRPGEEAPTPAAGGGGDHRGAEAVPGNPGVPVVTQQKPSIRRDSALP